jgi:regulator of sirC expression with transglutaminase-like and TPR domain
MIRPIYCRYEAFQLFAEQLPTLHRASSLFRAAVAVAAHALDDVDPAAVEAQVEALATRVLSRVRNRTAPALLAHLHLVLFEEEGFAGGSCCYDRPLYSYIPSVLQLRHGLPIALALVYKTVGDLVGLRVEGINSPGHFLVRVATPTGWLIVDPFFRGTVLNRDEAFGRIEWALKRRVPRHRAYLTTASHAQWLSRMLRNLENAFASGQRHNDLEAMRELHQLLEAQALSV